MPDASWQSTISTGITTLGGVALAWIAYLQVKAQKKLDRMDEAAKRRERKLDECTQVMKDVGTQLSNRE